jgi:thioredoxin 1
MEHLDSISFRTKVFDYEKATEWKYLGDKPAIIDFYADWCGPCKAVAPILEQLEKEYEGKITIYKVNTESDSELSGVFGIRSIPTFLFIPMEGQPSMGSGSMPKANFVKLINEVLKVQ